MKIYSINSQNSFKGVSINTKNVNRIESKIQKLSRDSLERINKAYIEGSNKDALNISAKLDAITAEMIIRKKIENEKPWYKSRKLKEVDALEAKQKTALIKEQDAILLACKEENKLSEEEKSAFIAQIQEDEILEADNLKRIKRNDNLNILQAKLSDNSKGFSRIAGYEKEKEILNKYFISEILKEKAGEEASVPNSVLFFGPTGNGKTTFARAFAAETGCKLETGRASNFLEMLNTKMNKAKENFQTNGIRTILFIDEFDKIVSENTAMTEELNKILSDCSNKYHCTIFATTNHPLNISLPLVGENSIFPYIVSMDPPNSQNKIDILKYYLNERGDKNLDYNKLVDLLEGIERSTGKRFNIAQLKEICLKLPDNDFSETNLINIINHTEPTIDKNALNKYMNEMQNLMVNEINK